MIILKWLQSINGGGYMLNVIVGAFVCFIFGAILGSNIKNKGLCSLVLACAVIVWLYGAAYDGFVDVTGKVEIDSVMSYDNYPVSSGDGFGRSRYLDEVKLRKEVASYSASSGLRVEFNDARKEVISCLADGRDYFYLSDLAWR